VLECTACHRVFHAACHQRQQRQLRQQHYKIRPQQQQDSKGKVPAGQQQDAEEVADGGGDAGGAGHWFHSAECRRVHRALQRLCGAGDMRVAFTSRHSPGAQQTAASTASSQTTNSSNSNKDGNSSNNDNGDRGQVFGVAGPHAPLSASSGNTGSYNNNDKSGNIIAKEE
ncbi:hypothetical protein Agub_g6630, partial [Astrephomene gubernaculifera]